VAALARNLTVPAILVIYSFNDFRKQTLGEHVQHGR